MTAWYNEIDPKAAAWLRELIHRNLIAPGDVDERSIEDVHPDDLRPYTQCHFFAGIGVWSYALRRAGWSDERRVWTGSCPCQPYSQAGKGAGFDDERHLWPAWEHLIRVCRPPSLFGEQVASKAADAWADLVQDDLEALDYTFGAEPFPAASVGAPHIRDRLYWMAHHHQFARGQRRALDGRRHKRSDAVARTGLSGSVGPRVERLDDDSCIGRERWPDTEGRTIEGSPVGRESVSDAQCAGVTSVVGHHHGSRLQGRGVSAGERSSECTPWSPSDFVWCRDGKWRPIEPGSFPLAHGSPARVGRLRGYGNAIVSEAAKVWIEAYLEVDL